MPAIPSTSIVLHPRHPSRLPFGSRQLAGAHCRSVLTGPNASAKNPLPEKRKWQACPGRPSHRCFSVWKGNSASNRTRAHGKENPLTFMRYGSIAQPASLVRGSSRRITIVRFRPADIRVINRRICLSSCCLLCRPSLRRIERKTQPGVNVTLDRVARRSAETTQKR